MSHDPPKQILLVDDEENTSLILGEILKQEGYCVLIASNGKEALNVLNHQSIDLVLTDIKMPEMDGMKFLEEIAKGKFNLKVIVITAYAQIESYLNACDLGAFEYLKKPLDLIDLKLIIRKALQDKPKTLSGQL